MSQVVYLYDYVPHPYEEVRALLLTEAEGLFRPGGEAATSRAEEVSTTLGFAINGIEVTREVAVEVGQAAEQHRPFPITTVPLRWRAARLPGAFPSMAAELQAYALTSTETQLSLLGEYRPPLGPVGEAVDRLVLHRVAQASLHRFFEELTGHIAMRLQKRSRSHP